MTDDEDGILGGRCPKHSTLEFMAVGKKYLLDSTRCDVCLDIALAELDDADTPPESYVDLNTNSTLDDRIRRDKNLRCSYCPPNQDENRKRRATHGKTKPKHKNHRG